MQEYRCITKLSCLLLLLMSIMVSCVGTPDIPPKPYGATPTAEQVEWQDMEYYMLVHFGLQTFVDADKDSIHIDPLQFTPSSVDCRQWAATAKAAGMKGIILVAKDDDGFCLWPSKYSSNTVRESAWEDGTGDILKRLSDACKEYDLKFGVYLSPRDINHPQFGTAEYNQSFAGALTEVTSDYGAVFEVKLDGANSDGEDGRTQLYDWTLFNNIILHNQPKAIISSDIGPGSRSVGNKGAEVTNWSRLNVTNFGQGIDAPPMDTLRQGNIYGEDWVPTEVCASIRSDWYYNPSTDHKLKSVRQLMDLYYTSVGRNANLLLNVSPGRTGRIHQSDSVRLMEFRRALDDVFKTDLVQGAKIEASDVRGNSDGFAEINLQDANYNSYWTTNDSVTSASLEITYRKDKTFNRLLLQEYIPLGQRIAKFNVECFINEQWVEVASATTVGYKRVLRFPSITTKRVRINIQQSLDSPILSKIALFAAKEYLAEPRITRSKEGFVSITCASSDPNVYYTLDGSNPTIESLLYKEPFAFPEGGRVKAIAVIEEGKSKSLIASAKFDIAPTKWEVIAPSFMNLDNIIDGREDTFAEVYKSHPVIVDLGEELPLRGLVYVPSLNPRASNVYRFNYYISNDGKYWTKVVDNASFPNMKNKPTRQELLFGKTVNARYIKFMSLESVKRGSKYAIAELSVITRK